MLICSNSVIGKVADGGKTLKPLTWRGKEMIYNPQPVVADADGWCEVEAPQRGYVVYGE